MHMHYKPYTKGTIMHSNTLTQKFHTFLTWKLSFPFSTSFQLIKEKLKEDSLGSLFKVSILFSSPH